MYKKRGLHLHTPTKIFLISLASVIAAYLVFITTKTTLDWFNTRQEIAEIPEMSESTSTRVPQDMKEAFREEYTDRYGDSDIDIPISFFEDNYEKFGPDVMISVLNDNKFCHEQGHNIGRVIYAHTKDVAESTAICKNQCTGGCIHGALMGLIESEHPEKKTDPGAHVSTADLTPALTEKLQTMCDNSAITTYTGRGDCYHAMGHALLTLANYDIPSGIDLCHLYDQQGIGSVYFCATGIYMERDIVYGEDDTKISPIYPCSNYPYPAACFRYTLRRSFKLDSEYETAAQTCLSLSGSQRSGCFHGLGFGAYKTVYRDKSKVNAVCGQGNDIDKQMCLEGLFGKLSVYDATFKEGICELYTAGSQQMCIAASTMRNFSTKRDFTLYSK
jgi:hypothetical protein